MKVAEDRIKGYVTHGQSRHDGFFAPSPQCFFNHKISGGGVTTLALEKAKSVVDV